MTEEINITNFKYNERLKSLLVLYVSRVYEECAEFDDDTLIMEYELLKRENKLHLLFEEEFFTGFMNDSNNYARSRFGQHG